MIHGIDTTTDVPIEVFDQGLTTRHILLRADLVGFASRVVHASLIHVENAVVFIVHHLIDQVFFKRVVSRRNFQIFLLLFELSGRQP